MHFVANQYKKILQEAQVCVNRIHEHNNQTAGGTVYYLTKGLKDLRVLPKSNQTSPYIEGHAEANLTGMKYNTVVS